MATKILFRRGGSTLIPTLDVGEPGWEEDTLTLAVGDGTTSPPLIATTKTSQDMDYSLVPQFKFNTIKVISGNASEPSILFPNGSATDTGFYSPASAQIGTAVGGEQVSLAQSTSYDYFIEVRHLNTDAILLPTGSTGQRPSSSVEGQIRFNTTLNSGLGRLEYYDGSNTWQSIANFNNLNNVTGTNAANGIITFSNGLIMQWGHLVGPYNESSFPTINFPTAFPTACVNVTPIIDNTGHAGSTPTGISIWNISRTSVTLNFMGYQSGAISNIAGAYWTALGY